jgi:hypothetical protein
MEAADVDRGVARGGRYATSNGLGGFRCIVLDVYVDAGFGKTGEQLVQCCQMDAAASAGFAGWICEVKCSIKGLELDKCHVSHGAMSVAGSIDTRIVDHDDLTVTAKAHVDLQDIRSIP